MDADSRRRQLLERIHRRYPTKTETVRFDPIELQFTRIADSDQVLADVAEEEDRRHRSGQTGGALLQMPYWAELWDSATAVSQWLIRCHSPNGSLANQRILDLGCGMGLTGTIAAALGGRVLFADLATPALLLAELNSLPYAQRVQHRQLNWRADHLHQRFDLILGADILYERAEWDFLDPFWREHLKPGGQIVLGEPLRQTGDAFGQWITSRGWDLVEVRETIPSRPTPIRLFLLSTKKSLQNG